MSETFISTPALDLANALRSFAILKQRTGALDDARRLWTEARDLYAEAGVWEGVVESETRLGQLRVG
jgi:hypothetical protein